MTAPTFGPADMLPDPPLAGSLVIVGGKLARVTAVVDYPAGHPHGGPIRAELPAREWRTAYGSRWSGVRPDGSAHNTPTAYRDPQRWRS